MGDGTGMMLSCIARQDADGVRQGFAWDGEHLLAVTGVRLSTLWQGDDRYHATVNATFTLEHPDGHSMERELTGHVLNLIPLRNRREGQGHPHLRGPHPLGALGAPLAANGRGRAATEGDDPALVGYGWSEYLDQIIDDVPVGIRE